MRCTVVRGSDLEEGESQGLPVWSRHVGDPVLESNRTRRVDFALFMVDALTNDELVHEAPAIVGRETPSALAITGSFSDSCRDFTSHATKVGSQQGKDISRVEIHYTDGRVVEDETIDRPDYSLDGAAGGEIDFVLVKSGTTRERFDCSQENRPPTAVLEIKTPPVDQTVGHCFDFSFGGLACQQSAARTDWTSTTQIPDDGGSDSGFFHWVCGAFGDSSLCSFTTASVASAAATPTTTSRAGRSTAATARPRAEAGAPIRRQRFPTTGR